MSSRQCSWILRLQYRTFPTYESIVANHTVDAGGDRAGVRWYELRKPSGGAWTIYQQGTYAPNDGDHRWMGSIAMDAAGNIALGFSASSATTWPSIRYVTRNAGDPLGPPDRRREPVLELLDLRVQALSRCLDLPYRLS